MNILEQTENTLKAAISEAIVAAELATEAQLPEIILEKTREEKHGDFATNIAMQLARIAKKAPRDIAEAIVAHFDKSQATVEKIEIAGPGFINFFMGESFLGDLIPAILEAKEAYGESSTGKGERVQVEFVSV